MTTTIFTPSRVLLVGIAGIAAAALSAFTANAEAGPVITTTIHNSSHSTTTEAIIGTLVHAEARVATTTGTTTPTGTVNFNVYAGTSCSGTASVHSNVPLVNGVAESSTTSVPAAGLSYRVLYSGDGTHAPSEGSCTALTAKSAHASITLALSTTTARVGASVTGMATLGNTTSNASGTVTYTAYSNSSCNANAKSAGTKSVTNASVPASDSIQFTAPGTYYWQAVYSGDANNRAATSSCASGKLNITATSTPGGGGAGNHGNHNGWVFGLPFGILKKVFNDLGLPPGIFKKFEDRLSDEDVVDLKLKIRETKEKNDDRHDGDKEERKNAKELRKEIREKAKDAREKAKEERKKHKKDKDEDEDEDD